MPRLTITKKQRRIFRCRTCGKNHQSHLGLCSYSVCETALEVNLEAASYCLSDEREPAQLTRPLKTQRGLSRFQRKMLRAPNLPHRIFSAKSSPPVELLHLLILPAPPAHHLLP